MGNRVVKISKESKTPEYTSKVLMRQLSNRQPPKHKTLRFLNSDPFENIVISIYAYKAQNIGDLSFKKGEKFELIEKSDPDWWTAKQIETGDIGYIPVNYVGATFLESEDWYYGFIGRRYAEKLLQCGDLPVGTFLIRRIGEKTSNSLKSYALSIRDGDPLNPNEHSVKHYQIKETPNGNYIMSNNREFQYLQDVVQFYSTKPGGLCQALSLACPKPYPIAIPILQSKSNEIERKDLKIIKILGRGNFGNVFYGTFLDQTEVAIKVLRPGTMALQAFLKEGEIMRLCRHDKLVKLYGVCSRGEPSIIVTEFMGKGALLDYLKENPEGTALKLPDLVDMCAQVASGMSYLESIKIVHRNLAARNILVGDYNEVKIGNFGLARILEDNEYLVQKDDIMDCTNILWTAPEALLSGKFSTKSDVWSYGVLLYEVITFGQVPYAGMARRDYLEQVSKWKYRLPKPTYVECPDSYYDMMLKCWDEVADHRPTFEYLYYFFEDYFVSTERQSHKTEDIMDSEHQ